MEVREGKIVEWHADCIVIRVPMTGADVERACLRKYDAVQVGLPDGRTISPEQRRKAYALMGEIAEWSGHTPDEVKLTQKHEFVTHHLDALHKELFSLSDCDMTTAREFIGYLIDLVIEFGVPTHVPLYELCDDIRRYVYACLTHKVCCVCGQKADLHHAEDRVGMGRNRQNIIHEGMRVIPLCRVHHNLAHSIGDQKLMATFHIESMQATREICKIWGLKHECD